MHIPWEVLETPKMPVYIGVYGVGDDDVRLPTIWTNLCYVQKGAPPIGQETREHTEDFFSRVERIVSEANKVGKSVYELAQETGFAGTLSDWLESLKAPAPEKGIDYFTDQDKSDFVQLVLDALPNAEEGDY